MLEVRAADLRCIVHDEDGLVLKGLAHHVPNCWDTT